MKTATTKIIKMLHTATAGFQKSTEVRLILIYLDYNSDKPQSPLLLIFVTKEYPTLHFKKSPFIPVIRHFVVSVKSLLRFCKFCPGRFEIPDSCSSGSPEIHIHNLSISHFISFYYDERHNRGPLGHKRLEK